MFDLVKVYVGEIFKIQDFLKATRNHLSSCIVIDLAITYFHILFSDPNDRCITEVGGEELDIYGGRHQNELEVCPPVDKPSKNPEEEVPMQMTLMHLVHYDHFVPRQVRVRGKLPKQQAFCQEQNLGNHGSAAFKSNLEDTSENQLYIIYIYNIYIYIIYICTSVKVVNKTSDTENK